MDINIPIIDGMECSKKIRALSDTKKAAIPIFAITGNAMNYSPEDFTAVGINEYLQKPINFDQLVELAEKYMA
jgi:CheY-like chemotaxis protein